MKRSKSNPYFSIDLASGIIKDEYGKTYSIEQFRRFIESGETPLDMTMMVQRLISLNFDINKLREFYQSC